jgi:hypothetical protein
LALLESLRLLAVSILQATHWELQLCPFLYIMEFAHTKYWSCNVCTIGTPRDAIAENADTENPVILCELTTSGFSSSKMRVSDGIINGL